MDLLKGEESNMGNAEGEELNPTFDLTKGGNNLEALKEREKTFMSFCTKRNTTRNQTCELEKWRNTALELLKGT